MITRIGIVAGDIWHLLENEKEMALSSMISQIGKSREIVLMGLGWLAREGHIILREDEGNYIASLRKRTA